MPVLTTPDSCSSKEQSRPAHFQKRTNLPVHLPRFETEETSVALPEIPYTFSIVFLHLLFVLRENRSLFVVRSNKVSGFSWDLRCD